MAMKNLRLKKKLIEKKLEIEKKTRSSHVDHMKSLFFEHFFEILPDYIENVCDGLKCQKILKEQSTISLL